MSSFARVLIDRSEGRELDYSIPENLRVGVSVGDRVVVMVRNRRAVGTILALLTHSSVPGIKPIESLVGGETSLPPVMMRLADWMADYYCAPIASVMRTMLPPMLRGEKITGKKVRMARLLKTPSAEDLDSLGKGAPKQRAILELIGKSGVPLAVPEILRVCDASDSSLKALVRGGWLGVTEERVVGFSGDGEEVLPSRTPSLNPDQERVVQELHEAIGALEGGGDAPLPFLLHGVTGSGKTEVYLRALARVLKNGKSALVLVPEIALTPQTVERFRSRFEHEENGGARVAVLHSHLTDAERREEWMRLQRGEARIAIGARSAVFAPLKDLGIIIVDEEHENTYKQEETPRYHARDVAVMRGRLEDCPVILGSATPSVESYRNVKSGKYRLLGLPRRADGQIMPLIRVVDLRLQGKRAKVEGGLSAPLQMGITKRLELGQQTILFLNRRGFSTAMLCQQCGHVCRCPNCSLSLTLHRADNRLACHLCGHAAKPPSRCPECKDPGIQHAGIGTQRVEESVRKFFPSARIARMDADTMTRKGSYAEVLGKFRARQIDILIGTQMIAKGLDFPNVTLVGIINADIGLHSPDFRAGERTFQLLTQVAGRAGRGETEGEVIVQTFSPASPSIQHARHHDYAGFYDQEISFREAFRHPPFTRMLLVQVRGISQEKASFAADSLAKTFREKASGSIEVSEAAPAPLERAHGQYRFHVTLKSTSGAALGKLAREVTAAIKLPEGVIMTLDVDPYSMM
ncbi:MAG: replication restart helicase PriA [Chthoniobacterales bacterium]